MMSTEQEQEDELFEAEEILDDALQQESDGQIIRKWLIKWKGYENENDNTWEPKQHLEHLEIWKEYENKIKYHRHNDTNDLSMVEQFEHLQILKCTINILSNNTSKHLLITQQTLGNAVNIKKIEKLVKSSEKKLTSKLSSFGPQQILQGILSNHNSLELYKECIKIFIKYISNKKISLQTITDLNISQRLVGFLKYDDYKLKYLSLYILHLISKQDINIYSNIDCIQILIEIIKQNKDKKIIDEDKENQEIIKNIVSILRNIGQQNIKILIEQNIFKYLYFLCCNPITTDIETLVIISELISNVCKYKGLKHENIIFIIKCLSILVMYDISDILSPTIYAYNQVFTYLVLQNKINIKEVIENEENHDLKNKMQQKSNRDELLITGCIINEWKLNNIPFVINNMIKAFYTPFGNNKIKTMRFNKIERFINLMKYKCDRVKSFDLILICCIIASAQKYNYIKEILADIIKYGVIGYLKRDIFKGECIENDQRGLMLIAAIIEYGNNEQVLMMMENEILFPFILKVICKQTLDQYIKNCIYRAIQKILNVYKQYKLDIVVSELIQKEIEKLKSNKYVLKENKEYLKTLNHIKVQ